jgi:hypothetical protein
MPPWKRLLRRYFFISLLVYIIISPIVLQGARRENHQLLLSISQIAILYVIIGLSLLFGFLELLVDRRFTAINRNSKESTDPSYLQLLILYGLLAVPPLGAFVILKWCLQLDSDDISSMVWSSFMAEMVIIFISGSEKDNAKLKKEANHLP